MWESRKNGIFFAINQKFDSQRFSYTYSWSQISWALFTVKSKNESKKILKSPFFANFQDLKFLKAKFGIS